MRNRAASISATAELLVLNINRISAMFTKKTIQLD